jgi:hypothetical protein
MVRPEWPYAAAREQILSDESGGCSGAEEVAGELDLAKEQVLRRTSKG